MSRYSLLPAVQEAHEANQLVTLYCDTRRPLASVQGYIEFISVEHVLLRSVSSRGFYDGFTLRLLNDIYRVECDGQYEQKVAYLYQSRSQKHEAFLPPLQHSADLGREVFLAAQTHEMLVLIEILGKELREGWVKQVHEDTVVLSLIDDAGHPDGDCTVLLEAINKVNCDSLNLQDFKILSRWPDI